MYPMFDLAEWNQALGENAQRHGGTEVVRKDFLWFLNLF